MRNFWRIAPVMVVMGVIIIGDGCNGQDTSCINQLLPCLNYLNGTKDVPRTCCDPLESVIKYDPKCLCTMISNKGSKKAEQAGINVNEAQELPGRCGLRVNPLSCLTVRGTGNTKNSIDNSSSVELSPSSSFMVMITPTALSVSLHAFWFQNL